MRTYTRKRTQYQIIEGVEDLCRLCLGKAETAVPIFSGDSENVCAKLSMRIMICVGLEMVHEDCLPNKICTDCLKELEHYYTFRKKCEVTYQKLKSHVLAVKDREYNKAMAVKIENKVLPVEEDAAVEPAPHLLLTINGDQQVELVNVANLDSEQLNSLQMQDTTMTEPTIPTSENQTTASDFSLIMSTMLIELGVMRQEENGLVLVDENLRTVELEGDDDTKIVLRLMEEDEEQTEISNERLSAPSPQFLQNKPEKENIVLPKLNTLNGKDSTSKSKDWTAVCATCCKRFASRSVLARHRRVHSGERPHACRVCARRFAQRAVMLRHELVHNERRPFACASCPKSFTQRGALAAHSRSHAASLALHRCAHCDKVFLYASGLSRHMATHQGRVFWCTACARAFSDQSSLRRHRANAHKQP